MQGRKIAEHALGLTDDRPHRHLDYDKAASVVFTEPEIADVGLAEADAFAEGRRIRVTKVPFMSSAKAIINDDPRGFIKIVSDPARGVVLGGCIVGRHAAELISIVALAVTAGLTAHDIRARHPGEPVRAPHPGRGPRRRHRVGERKPPTRSPRPRRHCPPSRPPTHVPR